MSESSQRVILGQSNEHIDYVSAEAPLHRAVVPAFIELKARAATAGFDLAIASSFRDYQRQLTIWNGKLSGQRPVYDSFGGELDIAELDEWQQVLAVLRWSALPGASRHHWGCDIDIYDRAAVAADYQLQLSPQEVADDGVFAPMHCWLDQLLAAEPELGFFRPYNEDRGGVAPERWHLSYAPVAMQLQSSLTPALWLQYALADCLGAATIETHIEEIFRRFVSVPAAAYPPRYRIA